MQPYLVLCVLTLCASLLAQEPAYKNPELPVDQRVADLLQRMTLEEKVAQTLCNLESDMLPMPGKMTQGGKFLPEKAPVALKNGIGQVAFLGATTGPRQSAEVRNDIQKWVKENTRLGIPVMFHEEGLHGHWAVGGNSYPQAIGLGSTWDPELIEQIFTRVAREMRHRGVHQVLAPVLDLGRDPRYGRIEETYGEDPFLAARLGVAAVRGFQGKGPGYDGDHVIATAKHYVHGQPEGGTNIAPSSYSERVLREQMLPPFEAAVKEANIGSIMPSYNEIDGLPSHTNPWLLRQMLRTEWGFEGTTVSDYFALQQLVTLHNLVATPAEAAARAMTAGTDMELPAPYAYSSLVELVRLGKVPVALLDAAVARILRHKFLSGLFENALVDPDQAEKTVADPETRKLALRAAEEAMVLLKNDKYVLPFDRSKLASLAVIGPNANKRRLGTYSGTPSYFVTVLDGIKKKVGEGVKISFAEGCHIADPDLTDPMANFMNFGVHASDPVEDRKRIAEAIETAKNADAIVLVLGGNEAVSREAIGTGFGAIPHLGDADTLELPGLQNELAEALLKLGKPVAVVLLNGRPYSIPFLAANAPAILEGWYLGQETGNAVANVLFGDVNPSGKLPVTIARNVGQLPVYYYQKPSARRGYVLSKNGPLYPFGFGLSYTTFSYGPLKLAAAKIAANGQTEASVEVTNSGARAGDEVVQLYIRDEVSSVTRPVKELKGFQRIHLAPGETKTVSFPITRESLQFYNTEMKRVVEPGTFRIMAGGNSEKTVAVKLEVVE